MTVVEKKVDTLESEVRKFAKDLPYWAKYIAERILSGNQVTEEVINTSYSYLLEDLKLAEETNKPEIAISYNTEKSGKYKMDLLLSKLENVEGVNALMENQILEFSPHLTIIYGANGSGKSGYVRLFKKAFYSKSPEDILPNINIEGSHKPVNATFTFKSESVDIPLGYLDKHNPEFKQFAVFDGKSVLRQLEQKNEFEFRPAGLSFFANFTDGIVKVEQKINFEINAKKAGFTSNDLSSLFDGDSEIKDLIKALSASSKIELLKKYVPFSDEDKAEKVKVQKEYDNLLLASRGKEKEIKNLESIKRLLSENKLAIEGLNSRFTVDSLSKIKNDIFDCLNKEETSKAEGIENFRTDKIEGIGTEEWRSFILAAEKFAKKQKSEDNNYPEDGDNCLLCHQPLSDDAETLIENYWTFIKSIAEANAKKAQVVLAQDKLLFEKNNFDLFPKDNTLTIWLSEKYPKEFESLKQKLNEQAALSASIISDIQSKIANNRIPIKVNFDEHKSIQDSLDASIIIFQDNEQNKELAKLLKAKLYLEHKEKLNLHLSKFETFIEAQVWMKKAGKANFAKRKITDSDKLLSDKYFNQKYIDTFNSECKKLNGNFGIEINHTGSAGKSYRQLKLKGKNPNAILSEGEQKVIAIADFIAEMHLSDVNRGIIFDDPVTSLDDNRKSEIAYRLSKEALIKQVVIFTHDLVFVSSLISHCKDLNISNDCHWIENLEGTQPGTIWLRNTPSFEKDYKTSGKAQKYYEEAKKSGPELREDKIKNGFAALRTSYETLVVFGLFKGIVQRFEERVSVDSLKNVFFTTEIRDELLDSFSQCCRYMEGHSHSDKYTYRKPQTENLNEEIQRFNAIKKKISDLKEI